MKTSNFFAVVGLLLTTGLANQVMGNIFDPAADFSASNNPDGVWSYGYSLTLGGPMILHTQTGNNNGLEQWFTEFTSEDFRAPGIVYNPTSSTINTTHLTPTIPPGGLGLHPGPDNQFSILRFTVPADNQYAVAGLFFGDDIVGTTTDVHILVNGKSIFDGAVNGFGLGTGPSFTLTETLHAGDHLDFAVGFGVNGNWSFDSTGVSLQVATAPDSPSPTLPNWASVPDFGSTAMMLIAALAGMAGCGRFEYCIKKV